MELSSGKKLILFDGYCHLCSRIVRVILRFDRRAAFLFASLDSPAGLEWRETLSIPSNIDSVVLIAANKWYIRSDAALEICKTLGGAFRLFLLFSVIPRTWRDRLYDFIASNRFRWFGKRNNCMLPTKEQAKRFI